MSSQRDCRAAIGVALFALLVVCAQLGLAELAGPEQPQNGFDPIRSDNELRLQMLKQRMAQLAGQSPQLFEAEDVRKFLNDEGAVAANRFINQRSNNVRRAFGLAKSALKWRKEAQLASQTAASFPCDLFRMGLIFEHGRAHQRLAQTGEFVETTPVIWLRLGALGSIVKQLERFTPSRLVSFAYNAPRNLLLGARNSARRLGRRARARQLARGAGEPRAPLVGNKSARLNQSLGHLLKAIAWWLDQWVARNSEEARATLVLDFEESDFAFASWSVGEFLIKLDDLFPDLFDQIIGFRFKPKLWSLHSPISMFNRIFKSRVASSPETDRKLRFVANEAAIAAHMARVDSQGFSTLPAHVSGTCQAPDATKAPAGCLESLGADSGSGPGLRDAQFWAALHNEYFSACKAKARQ